MYTLNWTNGRVDWLDVTAAIESGRDPVEILESVRAGRHWIHAELVRESDQVALAVYCQGKVTRGY